MLSHIVSGICPVLRKPRYLPNNYGITAEYPRITLLFQAALVSARLVYNISTEQDCTRLQNGHENLSTREISPFCSDFSRVYPPSPFWQQRGEGLTVWGALTKRVSRACARPRVYIARAYKRIWCIFGVFRCGFRIVSRVFPHIF